MWFFMLVMILLIPLAMIIFGAIYIKHPPREINSLFGYRTTRSMSSREAWEFAHHLFGKLWLICGIISMPVFILPMLFLFEADTSLISTVGAAITLVELLPMIIPVFFVESALKKNFDNNGERIVPKA